jgi:hypothetical protein
MPCPHNRLTWMPAPSRYRVPHVCSSGPRVVVDLLELLPPDVTKWSSQSVAAFMRLIGGSRSRLQNGTPAAFSRTAAQGAVPRILPDVTEKSALQLIQGPGRVYQKCSNELVAISAVRR